GDGNYDINYYGNYANNWETHVQNISYNSGGLSGYPDVVFRPSWPNHKLYIVWTEAETTGTKAIIGAPVHVKMLVKTIEPVPSYGVYPNTEQGSTYTTQRAGAFCYGAGQYSTVDYHPNKLVYHFDNLDPKMKYQVKAVYYWSGNGVSKGGGHSESWHQMLKADQTTLKITQVPETTVVKEIQLIPKHCYSDGQVDISIERKKGDYAICAGLELIAYEEEKGGHHGGTQLGESLTLPMAYQFKLMHSTPNPSNGRATIGYQIASQSHVSLKIYNTLGQVVKVMVDDVKQPGAYHPIWDGKDDRGKNAAAGVYFYRLCAGAFTDTKKMVVIR
ncbi:MAG: FlgD immunoglobulin-like domain containing protein, partial [Candidatus Edwardsbacteria bacterium]|nr:FlgD immunoglobulin-like domain containing protein [Candidatus Edwardsbacteria bacterium]